MYKAHFFQSEKNLKVGGAPYTQVQKKFRICFGVPCSHIQCTELVFYTVRYIGVRHDKSLKPCDNIFQHVPFSYINNSGYEKLKNASFYAVTLLIIEDSDIHE